MLILSKEDSLERMISCVVRTRRKYTRGPLDLFDTNYFLIAEEDYVDTEGLPFLGTETDTSYMMLIFKYIHTPV